MVTEREVRVAAAQLGPINLSDTRESVVSRMVILLREASDAKCNLVVFPELALTTFFPRYFMESEEQLDVFFERQMPGETTSPLFEEAKRLGIGFYLGYAERDGSHHYNTSILVDGRGDVIGKYRKIHLPGHSDHRPQLPFQHLEKRYFEVGNLGFPVWRAFEGIVGMCICNDRRWPETFRVMGLQGVEMVLLGYNTPEVNIYHREPSYRRMFHHLLSLQAGAYQNGTWVVAAAKAGSEDGHRLIGGSAIVAPTGEVVAQAVTEEDELLVYTCGLDSCRDIKENIFNFEKHRRIEHYSRIVEQTGVIFPN